jgi:serine/threonine-protein kinase HipA
MAELQSINKLIVKYHNEIVCTLMMSFDECNAVFQYDKKWLSNGFSISPIQLPLENKTFIAPATPFYGNFGIFEDINLCPKLKNYVFLHCNTTI